MLSIATVRLGVGAALAAVSSYLLALAIAVIASTPTQALTATKDLVVAVSAAAAAVVAWKGLQTWKHQSIANRKADFLDELVEECQEYVLAMSGPIQVVKFVRIGLRSYSDVPSTAPADPGWTAEVGFSLGGAATYIEKNGRRESERLRGLLEGVGVHVARARSLANKGQVLGFNQYGRCHNAVTLLTWQYDRVQAFAVMVESDTLNFAHPEVQESMRKVLSLDSSTIESGLQEPLAELLAFTRSSYEDIYI